MKLQMIRFWSTGSLKCRFILNMPIRAVERLGWKKGDLIGAVIDGDTLILRRDRDIERKKPSPANERGDL